MYMLIFILRNLSMYDEYSPVWTVRANRYRMRIANKNKMITDDIYQTFVSIAEANDTRKVDKCKNMTFIQKYKWSKH